MDWVRENILDPEKDSLPEEPQFNTLKSNSFGKQKHLRAMLFPTAVIFFTLLALTSAIPVDNGVEGEPEIECGPKSITVNFNTRNPFEGHVYVKGLFDQQGCRSDEHGRQVAGIELPFDSCNVARTRSLNPKGVFVSTTVVISFHPQFVTKVDRAYRVQCFYMEADKTVSAQIEVSEITTALQTAIVPMPVCKYEILEGGPSGQPIQFATIGQQVYHKWTCDSETVDTFCAVVHSCTVDDGNGDTVQILNQEGCALDKFLLNNLEYPTDLMAGQEAHVYKYADRSQLFYQCQISITIKEPNSESPAQLRLLKKREANFENTLDVRAELSALDIMDKNAVLPDSLRYRQLAGSPSISLQAAQNGVCMSMFGLSLFVAMGVTIVAAIAILSACVLRPQNKM
ncbi:zona pellucida-like domain-containing protein [Ditylenchus destructor]|uniref:Zona pellucida-like domain-containing protein n=1 Tax=Ditylenchus destructor TaxID=166010 RepID=A0AAD4NCN8_9BILA|nr:zona pellucida-like domain-containing protein [Ditylenchus destructor]